jgi:extracellular elastinolytic metalloproteinase
MKTFFTKSCLLATAASALLLQPLHAQSPVAATPRPSTPAPVLGGLMGINPEDVRVSSTYFDAHSGLELVYVQQLYRGIPIYNRVLTLAFAQTKLVNRAGAVVPKPLLAGLSAVPTVPARAAVLAAVRPWLAAGLAEPTLVTPGSGAEARQTFAAPGLARRDIVVSLVWVADGTKPVRLAWNVNVELLATPDWLNIRIDAATGAVLEQDNWTVHEALPNRPQASAVKPQVTASAKELLRAQPLRVAATTSAKYYVVPFPKENLTGSTYQTEIDPWLKAGATNDATTHGWQYDGTTTYNTTKGNNVSAYDDGANTNAPGNFATSLTPVPFLDFTFLHDFSQTPRLPINRNNAVVNLFYWNNIVHDLLYQYGFTERTGNFQTDNLGRGGLGGDAVHAEAQDGLGSNNANFTTPPDGTFGKMQMYLFDRPQTLQVTAPAAIAGSYGEVESAMSTANKLANIGPVTGVVAYYDDAAATTHFACGPGGAGLTGKIALVDRSSACTFTSKVKAAQTAGAIGVIVVNNVAGAPVIMTGADNTITIPAVMITQANGATIAGQLANGVSVTLADTPQLDGDLDSGIMVHEYGHGISTRLTGGPVNSSCLGNAEEGGEGWSDYFALMLTTDWTTAQLTNGPTARTMGNYVLGQPATGPGIRRFPYSTSLTINPLTYASMTPSPEVHNIGEIWCATLWDMTWNIIQQQAAIEPNLYNSASTGGNAEALQLVMLGLKLQPCQPGFLDARNAIITADELLYGGAHRCAIWSAFARRGMGVSAVQGLSTSATDQTAAFDVPSGVQLKKATAPLAGNTINITLTATCDCLAPLSGYVLTDVLPTGLQYVSSTGGSLSGSTVTFPGLSFTAPLQVLTRTIVAQAATGADCATTQPVNDNRDALQVGGLTPAILAGTVAWAPSTARSFSPTGAWAVTDPNATSDAVLVSASFTPGTAATLSFTHYYDYEGTWDGGTVELSTDNGATWVDAGPFFLVNGYNSRFNATITPCFSGQTATPPLASVFITSLLNLSSFSGAPLRLRFRSQSDSTVGSEGWVIDDIQVTSGCGGTQQVQLLNPSNAVVGTSSIVTFLTPKPLPVELVRFEARWQSGRSLLEWATASEKDTDKFVVERSLDGATWVALGTVAAAGNSVRPLEYRWLDAGALALPAGLLYYRLRQLDFDGTFHFSPPRSVVRPGAAEALVLTARPNPGSGKELHLRLTAPETQSKATLTLLDATGRELWHETVPLTAGSAAVDWPRAAELRAGLYLIRAQLPDGRRATARVVRE